MDIAERFGAEAHFYTRIPMHPFWENLPERKRRDFPETYATLYDLKKHYKEWEDLYNKPSVKMTYSYSAGKMLSVAKNYISEHRIDMVVMGTHGAGGMEEFVFGSNAAKMVRHAPCPVLVVKKPVQDMHFRHIVFASDFDKKALPEFEWLVKFAKVYGAHLYLLNILPFPQFEAPATMSHPDTAPFEALCKDIPYTIHQHIDKNIEVGIANYARQVEADLVALAHYDRSFLERALTASITESLANHLDLPLLSL